MMKSIWIRFQLFDDDGKESFQEVINFGVKPYHEMLVKATERIRKERRNHNVYVQQVVKLD